MSMRIDDLPRHYSEAETLLGKRDQRTIANKTTLRRTVNDALVVEHHSTVIARFEMDGTKIFRTGGYSSVSTHRRLNVMAPENLAFRRIDYAGVIAVREGDETTVHPSGYCRANVRPNGRIIIEEEN